MTVTIVGITGNIGRELVKEGLRRGLTIRGVAPDGDIKALDARVTMYEGAAMDDEVLLEAFAGADVVITVFPASLSNPWAYSDEVRNVLRYAKLAGVPRVIGLVGSAGTRISETEHLVDSDYFGETTRHFYQNVYKSWNVYREERELDWAVIVPAARMQTHMPSRGGQYRVRTDEYLVTTDPNSKRYYDVSQISYADCAYALLDEVENHRYTHQFFCVGY